MLLDIANPALARLLVEKLGLEQVNRDFKIQVGTTINLSVDYLDLASTLKVYSLSKTYSGGVSGYNHSGWYLYGNVCPKGKRWEVLALSYDAASFVGKGGDVLYHTYLGLLNGSGTEQVKIKSLGASVSSLVLSPTDRFECPEDVGIGLYVSPADWLDASESVIHTINILVNEIDLHGGE